MTNDQFETQVRRVLDVISKKSKRDEYIKRLKKEHPDRINQIIKIAKDYD